MSRVDGYEYQRRRKVRRGPGKLQRKRVDPRVAQLALKLYGGTTAKDKGEPFNDDIPF